MEIYAMTWRQVLLLLHGLNEKKLHDFQVARVVGYSIHVHMTDPKHRLSLWDYWPLPSDPDKEERAAMAKREEEKRTKEAVELINYYREKGYIK